MITCEIIRTETVQLPAPSKCILTWHFRQRQDMFKIPQDYIIVEGQRYHCLSWGVKENSYETEVTLECWKV